LQLSPDIDATDILEQRINGGRQKSVPGLRSTVITSARCIVLEVRLSLLLEPGNDREPTSSRAHRALTPASAGESSIRRPIAATRSTVL
jgi:hypothetical protein